jgi:hypothetical protein
MNSPFVFLEDERSISGRLAIDLPPLRLFDLNTFGIDAERFLRDLLPSFDALPWDAYDVRLAQVNLLQRCHSDQADRLRAFLPGYYAGQTSLAEVGDLIDRLPMEARAAFEALRPYRQRSAASFTVSHPESGLPWIERVPTKAFAQGGPTDFRSMARVFAETPIEVTAHPEFQRLLAGVVELAGQVAAPRRACRVVFHQVRTIARAGASSAVVPEGIHQDGADLIVSALVLERHGLIGGESIVYGPDKKTPYLRTLLQPGQGLFHADSGSDLWHGVSPIAVDPEASAAIGKRSIVGFDIHLSRPAATIA